ncbi:MAG: efflux RND transporter periplasmic adaptor subunit [Paracoccaceae bacterium]
MPGQSSCGTKRTAYEQLIAGIFAALSTTFLFQNLAYGEDASDTQAAFPGQIEALNTHDVSNQVDGVISEVHFKPGQIVEAGDVLFSIESEAYALALQTQRVNTIRAEKGLASARQDFERIQELNNRGSASDVQFLKAEVAFSIGDALLQQAKAELKMAEIDLERTTIRAPIGGIISRSAVNPGAYVETGNAPLARIDQMDPVRLSYAIPYVKRIEQLAINDLRSPRELLDTVTLHVKISDTWMYSETTTPDNLSSRVDSSSNTIIIWAELDNPSYQLRPGMRVTVISSIETK